MRQEVTNLVHQRPFEKMPMPCVVSSISTTHKKVVDVDGVQLPLGTLTPGHPQCYQRECALSRIAVL